MTKILACIDGSAYAEPVCCLAAWVANRHHLPLEILHVVERQDAVGARHDLSGAIGLGVKTRLLEELTQLGEAQSRLAIERGRALLEGAEKRARELGVDDVCAVHRHGGVLETILEREADARGIVIGKRGENHAFASDHIGSRIERVVRASNKPVLIAARDRDEPRRAVLAFDGSAASRRALERCAVSPMLTDLPVHLVMARRDDAANRTLMAEAMETLSGRDVLTTLENVKPTELITRVIAQTPAAILVMGAYGHSPIRNLVVGSTTTEMIRTTHAPVLLIR